MANAEVKERLEQIEKELIQYKYIMDKLFNYQLSLTDDEREQFITDNQDDINKMQILRKEQIDLLWKLMPPEKQREYLDKYSEE